MRVCIVGCGAVGSLFAANLATLDDVEVWAFDLYAGARRRDQRATVCASPAPARSLGRLRATTDAAELPPCDFGIVATKAMHADAAIAATAHAFADGAVASVQNGVGNEETLARARRARDPRHDVPGGQAPRARARAVGRQGRHDVRPVRAEPGAARRRSSGSPTPARAPGMPTDGGRRRARPRSGAR